MTNGQDLTAEYALLWSLRNWDLLGCEVNLAYNLPLKHNFKILHIDAPLKLVSSHPLRQIKFILELCVLGLTGILSTLCRA